MIMNSNFDADKFSNPESRLNVKKLGSFEAYAGFHVMQPSPLDPGYT